MTRLALLLITVGWIQGNSAGKHYLIETEDNKHRSSGEFPIFQDYREITKEKKKKKDDCMCGKQPPQPEIAGGMEAVPHEFPWLVRIVGRCPGETNKRGSKHHVKILQEKYEIIIFVKSWIYLSNF